MVGKRRVKTVDVHCHVSVPEATELLKGTKIERRLGAGIALGGYDALLPGWRQVDEDTFGELLIKLILQRNLPAKAPSLNLPTQWRSDRMIALEKDGALTLLWMIAFRDQATADDFASVYSSILDHLKSASNGYCVTTQSNGVLVIVGPASAPLAQLAPAIWKATTLTTTPITNGPPGLLERATDAIVKPIAAHS